jgi:hypothetical protein
MEESTAMEQQGTSPTVDRVEEQSKAKHSTAQQSV